MFRHWLQEDTCEWRVLRREAVAAERRLADRRVAAVAWSGPERRVGIERRAAFA
jgi:hypothetical protein